MFGDDNPTEPRQKGLIECCYEYGAAGLIERKIHRKFVQIVQLRIYVAGKYLEGVDARFEKSMFFIHVFQHFGYDDRIVFHICICVQVLINRFAFICNPFNKWFGGTVIGLQMFFGNIDEIVTRIDCNHIRVQTGQCFGENSGATSYLEQLHILQWSWRSNIRLQSLLRCDETITNEWDSASRSERAK